MFKIEINTLAGSLFTFCLYSILAGDVRGFLFFGMGASKNTVWRMATYDLRGMEDGNFSRFKCKNAMGNEGIILSQTAFPNG